MTKSRIQNLANMPFKNIHEIKIIAKIVEFTIFQFEISSSCNFPWKGGADPLGTDPMSPTLDLSMNTLNVRAVMVSM